MNDLLQTRLFRLLVESSQKIANEKMQIAYEDFMEQLRTVSQSDYSEVFRILNTTCIELASLKSLYRYEQGGKMP